VICFRRTSNIEELNGLNKVSSFRHHLVSCHIGYKNFPIFFL
jgi:hypothetical protein